MQSDATHEQARRMIDAFAAQMARKSGLPRDQRAQRELELRSHIHDAASARAGGPPNLQAVQATITELGDERKVLAAFFPASTSEGPATFWNRFWAYAIDSIVVSFVMSGAIVLVMFNLVDERIGDGDAYNADCTIVPLDLFPWLFVGCSGSPEDLADARMQNIAALTIFVSHFAGWIVYGTWMDWHRGATFGKSAMRLRTDAAGRPTFGQALARNLVKGHLLLLVLDTAVGWVFGRGRGQRLSDRWAGTRVLQEAKP